MDQGRFRVGSLASSSQAALRKAKHLAGTAILQIAFVASTVTAALPAGAQEPSAAASDLMLTIRSLRDNDGLPYVVVDKLEARVFVFNERGAMVASTAALLGLARGDHSVPGIGDRPLHAIKPEERTTPAGRFLAEAGRNSTGEHVLWIDYDAALSLHRIRGDARERLHQRLLSATPNDNRTSFGCVTVPVQFYERVIKSAFAGGRGIVYIMPETMSWQRAFSFNTRTPEIIRVSNSIAE